MHLLFSRVLPATSDFNASDRSNTLNHGNTPHLLLQLCSPASSQRNEPLFQGLELCSAPAAALLLARLAAPPLALQPREGQVFGLVALTHVKQRRFTGCALLPALYGGSQVTHKAKPRDGKK